MTPPYTHSQQLHISPPPAPAPTPGCRCELFTPNPSNKSPKTPGPLENPTTPQKNNSAFCEKEIDFFLVWVYTTGTWMKRVKKWSNVE